MDENLPDINSPMILPIDNNVWRIVISNNRDRRNNQIPAVREFSLSPVDEYKLSVDWDKYTTAEECIARIGATYRFQMTEYKPYNNREIYSISTTFLQTIEAVDHTIHNPIKVNPCQKGLPSNPAHSLICIISEFDEPEVYLKIRNHAKDKIIAYDMDKTEKLVIEYRKQCEEETLPAN